MPVNLSRMTALQQGAAAGDAQCMFQLAVALYHGQGCPGDRPAAIKWWRRGAQAGHEGCKARLEEALEGGGGMAGDGTAPQRQQQQEEGAATAATGDGLGVSPAAEEARVAVAGIPDADLDTAFMGACRDGKLAMMHELLSLTGHRRVDVHAMKEAAFRQSCHVGRMAVMRKLLSLTGDRTVDVHAMHEGALHHACWNGQLEVVRELLALTGDRRMDVHAKEEDAFRHACQQGHLDVVHELLGLTGDRRVDVHAKEECAFRLACLKGHLGVVHELLGLTGDRLAFSEYDTMPKAGLEMLASGLGDPHSPAVAATWQAISSPGGMMCNVEADPKAREAAATGYRVYKWGRRGGLVLRRRAAIELQRQEGTRAAQA